MGHFTKILCGACVALAAVVTRADIFQWEYINPADPSLGKRQSLTLVQDGRGVDSVPGADLAGRDLSKAYLIDANLTNTSFASRIEVQGSTLVEFPWGYERIDFIDFRDTTLTDADFTGADVRGANFSLGYSPPLTQSSHYSFTGGISLQQLYSTASYQAHDLRGIDLTGHLIIGGNFAGQNLAYANFTEASLTDADFTGAAINGANFTNIASGTGISLAQLYSTANYEAHNLSGISLAGNELSGGNFESLNLTNVDFSSATLTSADFTNAVVRGASFGVSKYSLFRNATITAGTGISNSQLYATASYRAHDLSGISFVGNNLEGGNFAGQNLENARFAGATITNADFTGADILGTNFDVFAYFSGQTFITGTGISPSQLYSTASYQVHDLRGIHLDSNNLVDTNFAGQNLTNASFSSATLTGADFTDANVQGANFGATTSKGFTLAQLYSTASYRAKNLSGVNLYSNNLAGGNFTRQNLTNTYFYGATLTGADFSGADARGAQYLDFTGTITTNLVRPNGHLDGLDLSAGGLLAVRDYHGDPLQGLGPIPITIDQHLAIGPGGVLQMLFDADHWDSTISFAPGIPAMLGGVLELTYAPGVNLAGEIGRTIDLFDWSGVHPTGTFDVESPYTWDLSQLYTTGEVTLTAVPEPASGLLIAAGFGAFVLHRRWRLCQRFFMSEITVDVAEQSPSAWRLRR
jgi:uncharacterized protein YjbI with pentapeptide repeats